jgi:hypothetical protein
MFDQAIITNKVELFNILKRVGQDPDNPLGLTLGDVSGYIYKEHRILQPTSFYITPAKRAVGLLSYIEKTKFFSTNGRICVNKIDLNPKKYIIYKRYNKGKP